jgi:small-conductance mechanosensitive channel
MITLNAPKITAAQRKQVQALKQQLEGVKERVAGNNEKVTQLVRKQEQLRKEAQKLEGDAAAFRDGGEVKLFEKRKQLERLADVARQAEAECFDDKLPLFHAIDQAQELVGKLSLPVYEALLDRIGAAMAPFYRNFLTARWIARDAEAVNHLTSTLFRHRCMSTDSVQRLSEAGTDVIGKLDALLSAGEIFRFEGAEVPSSEESAASAT